MKLNKSAMNAATLQLLVERYWNPSQYNNGDIPNLSKTVVGAFEYLYAHGLLRTAEGADSAKGDLELMVSSMITDRGRAHIEALLAAPLPERIWRSPLGDPS